MSETNETKPGIKSTEFWLTIASNFAAILLTVSGAVDPKIGGIMMAVANGIYAITRGWVKK